MSRETEIISELGEYVDELIEEMGKLIKQRDEARTIARRYYWGWQLPDEMPLWILDKENREPRF